MTDHTKFRPATQEDAPQICELENLLFPENSWNELTMTSQLLCGSSWAAVTNSRVVGYAIVREQDGLRDLLRLGVAAPFKRQGIGLKLIELSLATHPAVLTVRRGNPAIRLYVRHGFKPVGVLEDAWVMRR